MPIARNSRARLLAILLAAFVWGAAPAGAQDRAPLERDFARWTESALWPAAEAHGVSRATFEAALGGVTLDWSLPDLNPPGAPAASEEHQAEFRAPSRYFDQGNIDTLVAQGRQRLARHQAALDRIEAAYGVPRAILIAIWARESNFGRASIPHDAIAVLATRAFIGRRPELFGAELLAALEMIERGFARRGAMRSSWAGALGQPQFMPSKYLLYAADGDGDGTRDIWGSEADTLASIANFLSERGWRGTRDWGFEAVVPASVPCAFEGPDRGRTIDEWTALGVARVAGRQFPDQERGETGFLVWPAGRNGPAFIATENFYVLKDYNESDLYALFIGHLADRLRGGGRFVADWETVGGFNRADVLGMQRHLEALGYDVGGADGLVGFKTRRSVGDFQAQNGLAQTCFPNSDVVARAR